MRQLRRTISARRARWREQKFTGAAVYRVRRVLRSGTATLIDRRAACVRGPTSAALDPRGSRDNGAGAGTGPAELINEAWVNTGRQNARLSGRAELWTRGEVAAERFPAAVGKRDRAVAGTGNGQRRIAFGWRSLIGSLARESR